ncbi:MAG TPA: FecR domain-containing protein [Gemmatimonadaceae bacterium]|nr:FecR domain-containing protein [Gemmatimonadaceae bacterium]
MTDDELDARPGPRRAWRTDEQWTRLSERITGAGSHAPAKRASVHWYAVAAAVLIAAAATLLVTRHVDNASRGRTYATAAGKRLVIHLDDGSIATLGPASSLRISSSRRGRDMSLTGLGAFRVVHDDARPFIVRAGAATARDVGTEFTVRAYPEDSLVSVAVTSGAVALSDTLHPAVLTTITAGHLGVVAPGGAPVQVHSADASTYASWTSGALSFDNASLARVAAELERWFGVVITIPDTRLAQRHVTAIYSAPTLAGVLDGLAAAASFNHAQHGDTITFTPRTR